MVGEPDSLTLVYLRRLDEKMDCVIDDLGELKQHVGACEAAIVRLQSSHDRLDERLRRRDQQAFSAADTPEYFLADIEALADIAKR
jgi:hypothetical protein